MRTRIFKLGLIIAPLAIVPGWAFCSEAKKCIQVVAGLDAKQISIWSTNAGALKINAHGDVLFGDSINEDESVLIKLGEGAPQVRKFSKLRGSVDPLGEVIGVYDTLRPKGRDPHLRSSDGGFRAFYFRSELTRPLSPPNAFGSVRYQTFSSTGRYWLVQFERESRITYEGEHSERVIRHLEGDAFVLAMLTGEGVATAGPLLVSFNFPRGTEWKLRAASDGLERLAFSDHLGGQRGWRTKVFSEANSHEGQALSLGAADLKFIEQTAVEGQVALISASGRWLVTHVLKNPDEPFRLYDLRSGVKRLQLPLLGALQKYLKTAKRSWPFSAIYLNRAAITHNDRWLAAEIQLSTSHDGSKQIAILRWDLQSTDLSPAILWIPKELQLTRFQFGLSADGVLRFVGANSSSLVLLDADLSADPVIVPLPEVDGSSRSWVHDIAISERLDRISVSTDAGTHLISVGTSGNDAVSKGIDSINLRPTTFGR